MALNGNISHTELWDDTDLVESWNNALDEYKKYHSLRAHGEDARQVLATNEEDDNATLGAMDDGAEQVYAEGVSDPRAKENMSHETPNRGVISPEDQPEVETNKARESTTIRTSAPPDHLIGQVHDEGLKNLLMSWYYAGYYTGLYEGRQQEKGNS